MVLHIVGSFVGLIKATLRTKIDGPVFRLNYNWTTAFCFLSCVLVSATEYIGNAIMCLGPDNAMSKVANTYCWIMSTHTIDSQRLNGSHYLSRGTTFSGTGAYRPGEHDITYHSYYQWVPFFLFFQGCLFYLPHLIWKTSEGKTLDRLLQGLQFNSMSDDREEKKANIVKYLRATRGHNMKYGVTYLVCEVLNWVNVICQAALLNKFVGGAFMDYGINVMFPKDIQKAPPLTSTFPRMTKCSFNYYGTSGGITRSDYLCLLPQNILNEKIFLFMWFWFVILSTINLIEVIWRIVLVVSPMVRVTFMERRGKLTADPKLEKVIRCMPLGDYCLLENLGTNLDASNFKDILLSFSNCHDNSIHPNADNSYQPYSHLDEVDCGGVMEAGV